MPLALFARFGDLDNVSVFSVCPVGVDEEARRQAGGQLIGHVNVMMLTK